MQGTKLYEIISLNIKDKKTEMKKVNGKDVIDYYYFDRSITGKTLKEIDSKTIKQDLNSRIRIRESELIRILNAVDKDNINMNEKYPFINALISLNVGKSVNDYYFDDSLKDKQGNVITETIYKLDRFILKRNKILIDAETGEAKDITDFEGVDRPVEYRYLMDSSGDIRNQKSIYIRSDLFEKVDEILRCGFPNDMEYEKFSKFNTYYALSSTDSIPLKDLPNIVVIDDYKKDLTEEYDIVSKDLTEVTCATTKQNILPFDGAGLVSVELARKWAKELHLNYVPAAWQFRCIIGLKGNLYTFDFHDFYKKLSDNRKANIRLDFWNDQQDIEKCNVIMTKSQFKFANEFDSYESWKKAFNTELFGYQRTFNISEYSEPLRKIKDQCVSAYQHIQTLSDLGNAEYKEEIAELCKPTIDTIKKCSIDANEFLKYRGVIKQRFDVDEATGETVETFIDNKETDGVPPYYLALRQNKNLWYDTYIQHKVKEDLSEMKRRAKVSKLLIDGNYQVWTPDLYGLAEYAFGNDDPQGLLESYQIYSNYWMNKGIEEVVIERNPHIAEESAVVRVASKNNTDENLFEKMAYWYQFQNTGIINASCHDTIALKTNSSDYDGDHIQTNSNSVLIAAAKRNKANTIIVGEDENTENKKKERVLHKINDINEIMRVNALGMQNDIGKVINKISILWSLPKSKTTQDYIKIMSIVGSLVIDYAKSGVKTDVPKDIAEFLKDKNKPIFMKYLDKKADDKDNDIRKLCEWAGLDEDETNEKVKFTKRDCTCDRICSYITEQLNKIYTDFPKDVIFDYRELIKDQERNLQNETYKKVLKKLLVLDKYHKEIHSKYKNDKETYFNKHNIFYTYARNQLLLCDLKSNAVNKTDVVDVDKILDYVINIYYTHRSFVKCNDYGILWNCFGDELIARCKGVKSGEDKMIGALSLAKNSNYFKKSVKASKTSSRIVKIEGLDNTSCTIYQSEIKAIKKQYKDNKMQKMMFVLLVLDRLSYDAFSQSEDEREMLFDEMQAEITNNNPNKKPKEFKRKDYNGFKIIRNTKNVINPYQVCKLAGVNKEFFDTAIKQFVQDQFVIINIDKMSYFTNINVDMKGKEYIFTDVNDIQKFVNKSFRYESEKYFRKIS